MEIINEQILNLALFFFIYSIIGWVIEFIYRYTVNSKFINPGFLYGPMLPIYGFSALAIIEISVIFKFNFFVNILLGILLVTVLEYIVASFCENVIGIKFWDYSDTKFNYKGRISLGFSVVWGILILFLLYFIHPFILGSMQTWSYYFKEGLFLLFFLVIIVDFIFTVFALLGIRKILIEFDNNISYGRFQKNMKRLSRLLDAFPDLYLFIKKRTKKRMKKRFKDFDELINRLK